MRHLIPISGKDSLAAALLQTTREPNLPYEFFFTDTGCELPETYEWLTKVESETGWEITRIGKNLLEVISKINMMPSPQMRFCTRLSKIEPMEEHYGRTECTVYFGLRADEDRPGARPSDGWTHVYPLRDAGIDIDGVWIILNAKGLLPPLFFWPSLYYRVLEMLGPLQHLVDKLQPFHAQRLFAGRSRANCYFCFFQRQYEILWLSETHPDLLWKTCWMERFVGTDRAADYHSLNQAFFFDEVVTRRKKILDRRAKEISELIIYHFAYEAGMPKPHVEFDNEIRGTSCGLLCGK